MASAEDRLIDEEARRAIAAQLDTTMMVEAAAGTGKTTSLVTRAISLLRAGKCDASSLAAITFTVKAAAQLRERMQERLEAELPKAAGEEHERLARAARDLDRMFIGTTHAFCARLLRERPIEAGLDPDFEELDEVEASIMALEFWQKWFDAHLATGDPRVEEAVRTGLTSELLGTSFAALIDHHGDVEIISERCAEPDLRSAVGRIVQFLRTVENDLPNPPRGKDGDAFEKMIVGLLGYERTHDLDEPLDQLGLLKIGAHGSKKPTQKNWPDKQRAKSYGVTYQPIGAAAKETLARWREYVHCIAMEAIVAALDDYRDERRSAARVTFNDLLVGARNMLRDHPDVRRYFQSRFTHLLVDEFQDTDPLQAEVLFLLTGEQTEERNWKALRPKPGSLFIVGDPKQSIYRFRRADIATYLTVRERIERSGGAIVQLSTNFRSTAAICDFVNATFPTLFDEASVLAGRQARHVDLAPAHAGAAIDGVYRLETEAGASVERAAAEAACIAAWIRHAVESKMQLGTGEAVHDARWSDFLLVSRVKTRLHHYAEALEREGVPYEVTGADGFRRSSWLRAALALLNTVVDPDDAVSMVAFLRGPLCGAADDELYRFRKSGGSWSPFAQLPADTPIAVRDGFELVREAIELARSHPPGAAIAKAFDRVGIASRAAAAEQGGTATGNVLLALAIARDESAAGASYAQIVERLGELLDAKVEIEEMDVDPSLDDAVRLMNLHQVKGLEAPVVFLIDPADAPDYPPDSHIDRSSDVSRGYFAIRNRKRSGWQSDDLALPRGWDTLAAREREFLDAEERRLQYVAATRAMQVLVVGVANKNGTSVGRWSELASGVSANLFPPGEGGEASPPHAEGVGESFSDALASIAQRFDAAGEESYSVAPITKISHGDHQSVVRAEEGLGRGTSWGRVLHRLFEAMLRDAQLDVRFYAESLLKDEERDAAELGDVVAAAEAVRQSSLWQRVLTADESYAEVPFALNVDAAKVGIAFEGETLLHGAIDLVFREGERWTVVDYKSDSTAGRLEELVRYYAPQVRHYVRFWSELTGAPTTGALLFVDGVKLVEVQ